LPILKRLNVRVTAINVGRLKINCRSSYGDC